MSADEELLPFVQREEWTKRAACAGMAGANRLFFPSRGESASEARWICQHCPVCAECLDYALRTGQRYGIWGGTSERDRRKMRRDVRAELVEQGVAAPTGPLRRTA
jgi:WhiB family redox-sensing transcriptional regulator